MTESTPPQPNFSSLTACKGALNSAKLRHTKLLCEVGVEGDCRASGVDEKSDLRTAIDLHAEERQRVGLEEFDNGVSATAAQFLWRLSGKALE